MRNTRLGLLRPAVKAYILRMGAAAKGATRNEVAMMTKRRIRERARTLFIERGFDATSLDMIVRSAGVTKGAFYAHYPSKASLVYEYLDTLDLDYRRRYEGLSGGGNASAILMGFTDSIAEILETQFGIDALRAVYGAQIARDITLDPFVSRDRELYRIYEDILDRGVREGAFDGGLDAARVADHIVTAIRGVVFEWCTRSPAFDLREAAASHIGLMLNGISRR